MVRENPSVPDAPNFDPLARLYRWMEYLSFGRLLERCRFHFLAECTQARQALLLGDGDGRFTARLLATNRTIHADAIDTSTAMLAELRRASTGSGDRLRTIQADLRTFIPDRSGYDLVVSHFFLDCLTDEELDAMAARILPHLAPAATWLISEFAIPEQGWRRRAARGLIRFLYLAFNKMTHLQVRKIPDYASTLTHHGFQRQQQWKSAGGLLVTEIWRLPDLS